MIACAPSTVEVSVVVMTYNHIGFIRQALDSVLAQQAKFAYEIVISEDLSTDGTREVVLEYRKQHPDRIRLLLSQHNLRSNAVVRRGIEAARGRYVAFLDGDDYWTDLRKLEKQVAFMQSYPQCSMCFHNARVVYEDNSRPSRNWTPANQPKFSGFEDIWMGNFIPMCSTLFRRAALADIPPWYEPLFPITDWPLHILAAMRGPLGYLGEVMGVYRQHGGGLYSTHSETQKLQRTLQFYRTMNVNFQYRYDALVRSAISKYFLEWAEEYASRGDRQQARQCFKTYLQGRPLNRFISARRALKMGARLYLPGAGMHA